jgi:hypothetical protein
LSNLPSDAFNAPRTRAEWVIVKDGDGDDGDRYWVDNSSGQGWRAVPDAATVYATKSEAQSANIPEGRRDVRIVSLEDARRDAERDVLDIKDFALTGDGEADPDELMEMANKLYDETVNTQFDAAWHIGELLWRAKKQKAHGEYLPWVAEHFHGTRQTAAIYVKIYEEGDSPANVTTSLHLERPSISAAVKAIATRKAESKPTPSKRDAAAKKRKTVRDTAMRKVKAAAEYIRTEAVKALGTLTATEAVEYASELEGYLSVIDQFYDQVNGMGTATEPSKS